MSGDQVAAASTFVCPSGGFESAGKFCTGCGERRLGSEDRSLRYYFDIVIDFLTHFDSKGYRSLACLIAKPGFLSVEQLRGARVRYAKPLSLFLSINVIYYFSIALFGANTFTTPLSKTLIFLFIPIYAVIFLAAFRTRRPYLVEHAVVATHLWSFILLLLAVVVPALGVALMWWHNAPGVATALAANDNPVTILLQVCIAAYLVLMLRRVYGASWWYCAVVALVIAWSFFHIVWLYRFFLFMITLHSL